MPSLVNSSLLCSDCQIRSAGQIRAAGFSNPARAEGETRTAKFGPPDLAIRREQKGRLGLPNSSRRI
ncbi:hypothetical protein QUF72_23250 [Desulfobacterales bacterium HSG2]|nr:hypothetical protein [Desulfobacterales bacterium HSG2]